jgi:hypothetical protein
MTLFALGISITCLFIAGALYSHVRAQRVTRCTWDELVAKIEPIASKGITAVALDHLAPTKNQLELEPGEMWDLIGGLTGLQRMKSNATRA